MMVDSCQYPVIRFFLSVCLHVSRITFIESLLAFPTPSVSYHGVRAIGGVGLSCGDGIGEVLVLCFGGGKVGGG